MFGALCGLEIQKKAVTKTTFVATGNPRNIMQVAAEGVRGPVWVGETGDQAAAVLRAPTRTAPGVVGSH